MGCFVAQAVAGWLVELSLDAQRNRKVWLERQRAAGKVRGPHPGGPGVRVRRNARRETASPSPPTLP